MAALQVCAKFMLPCARSVNLNCMNSSRSVSGFRTGVWCSAATPSASLPKFRSSPSTCGKLLDSKVDEAIAGGRGLPREIFASDCRSGLGWNHRVPGCELRRWLLTRSSMFGLCMCQVLHEILPWKPAPWFHKMAPAIAAPNMRWCRRLWDEWLGDSRHLPEKPNSGVPWWVTHPEECSSWQQRKRFWAFSTVQQLQGCFLLPPHPGTKPIVASWHRFFSLL